MLYIEHSKINILKHLISYILILSILSPPLSIFHIDNHLHISTFNSSSLAQYHHDFTIMSHDNTIMNHKHLIFIKNPTANKQADRKTATATTTTTTLTSPTTTSPTTATSPTTLTSPTTTSPTTTSPTTTTTTKHLYKNNKKM